MLIFQQIIQQTSNNIKIPICAPVVKLQWDRYQAGDCGRVDILERAKQCLQLTFYTFQRLIVKLNRFFDAVFLFCILVVLIWPFKSFSGSIDMFRYTYRNVRKLQVDCLYLWCLKEKDIVVCCIQYSTCTVYIPYQPKRILLCQFEERKKKVFSNYCRTKYCNFHFKVRQEFLKANCSSNVIL